jgi:hypothetical protein
VPLPIAIFVAVALGAALAWAATSELSRDEGPIVASRPFAVVLALAGFVYVPAVGYFATFHGDWSYVYVFPWRRVPSAIDLALVLASGAVMVASFLGAVPLVRRRKLAGLAALVVVPAMLAMGVVLAAGRRLAVSATYAQYHGEFGTEPIAASALGRSVLLMGIVLVVAIAWALRAIWAMNAEETRR